MLQVFGDFNNISKELKETIKPLKKGQKVVYRLFGGTFDPQTKKKFFGNPVIVCHDRIRDLDGRIVDIGIPRPGPESYVNGKVVLFKKFRPNDTGNIAYSGYFELYGGNVEHEELYVYLELCNDNESNENRDKSAPARFERVDAVKESKKKAAVLDSLTEALLLASQMKKEQRVAFAKLQNWDTQEDDEVLHTRIKEFAKERPEQFLALANDPEERKKSTIKDALDANIISYVPAEHKIIWGIDGSTLAKLDREHGDNPVEAFFQWTSEKGNGDSVLKTITRQLKAKKDQESGS